MSAGPEDEPQRVEDRQVLPMDWIPRVVTAVLLAVAVVLLVRLYGSQRQQRRAERRLARTREQARRIIDTAFDAYIAVDDGDRIIEWNLQAERTFGWTRDEVLGRQLHDVIIPVRFQEAHLRGIEHFLATGQGPVLNRRIELPALHRSGREFPIELAPWPVEVGGRQQFHAFLHDISDRQRQARWLRALEQSATSLMLADDFADAAPRLLAAICEALDWQLGLLWIRDGDVLRHAGQWHDPGKAEPALLASSEAQIFALGQGLPGRVWHSREPRWVEDVTLDDAFLRSEEVLAAGFRGALAFPVTSGDEVLGVLEFFSTIVHPPDADLLRKLVSLGNLLGQFLRRERAENALEGDREFLGAVLDNISEGIVACNSQGMLSLFNHATREFHGLPDVPIPPDRWAGYYDLYEADGRTPLRTERIPLYRALAGEQVHDAEIVIAPRGLDARTLVCNGRPLVTGAGRMLGAVVAMHDITERKQAEQRLIELAHYDQLTGLPNRLLFHETLARTLRQAAHSGSHASLLLLDLDRFKHVNDTQGHACGDELLRQVAARLVATLRAGDTVGRLGGDEFGVIVVSRDGPRGAATAASKLIDALRQPFDLEGREAIVTASIGITVFPDDGTDFDLLVKYADLAMYEAKNAGRNTFRFYTAQMNERSLARMDMEDALRRALDGGQFVLHYQPKVSIADGSWTGVESLLRWHRPGHGLVPPVDFIPMLEETGLIVPVGQWVIETVCRQIADWHQRIGAVPVAVNLSAQQLVRDAATREGTGLVAPRHALVEPGGGLFACVRQCLDDHPQARGLLEFELTESTLMQQATVAVEQLRELKQLGIGISIDDFGTGYSSLAYLKRFPIDAVKIDRAFISDVTSDEEDAAIVLAIIRLAHSLKLKVVAEGVESAEQLAFLHAQGCDQAQGYHLARPMPAEEIERLFLGG